MQLLKSKGWESGAALSLIVALLGAYFVMAPHAHANPLRPVAGTATAAASSTVVYMTPGTATTTTGVYDSWAAGANAYPDRASLFTIFTASSTSSTLKTSLEYAPNQPGVDCTVTPTLCDWYQDDLFFNTNASTSQPFNISTANSFTWNFASSSQGGAPVGNSNTAYKAVTVSVPARYIRAVYSLGAGGTNGAVYGVLVPQRQSN